MGLLDFFRKVGEGAKQGLKAGMDFLGNKVLPTVNKFAQPALGIMSLMPGPIGTAAKFGQGMLGTLNSVAKDDVPNEGIGAKIGKAAEGLNGTLNSLSRSQLKEIIKKYGGKIKAHVTSETDIFIRGIKDVSKEKYEDALKKCIPMIDEEGIFYILNESKKNNLNDYVNWHY